MNFRFSASLLRNRSSQILFGRRGDSTWSRFKDFVFATEKETFHADFIRRSHKWDGIDAKKQLLIYRDIGASRTFFMVSTLLPISLCGGSVMFWDSILHSSQDRLPIVKRLEKDSKEIGILVFLPLIAIFGVVGMLIRGQQTRVLRIYQDLNAVNSYIAIVSRNIVSQRQLQFRREECCGIYYDENGNSTLNFFLMLLFGNLQVGSRRLNVMDDCFLANNYRSYMMNETSVPPRLRISKPS